MKRSVLASNLSNPRIYSVIRKNVTYEKSRLERRITKGMRRGVVCMCVCRRSGEEREYNARRRRGKRVMEGKGGPTGFTSSDRFIDREMHARRGSKRRE